MRFKWKKPFNPSTWKPRKSKILWFFLISLIIYVWCGVYVCKDEISTFLYWILQSAKIKSKLLSGSGKLSSLTILQNWHRCATESEIVVHNTQTTQLESSERENMCTDYTPICLKPMCTYRSWQDEIFEKHLLLWGEILFSKGEIRLVLTPANSNK